MREAPTKRFTALATIGFGFVVGVGVLIRINNAVRYPPRWGLDAMFNERYIAGLLQTWALPAPDADWSTAHPPFFYYVSAALSRVLGIADSLDAIVPTRLLSAAAGLGMVALVFWLVRRVDPDNPRRAFLAAALLLFLPVHIYMSAMLSEEILAASLTSFALTLACVSLARRSPAAAGTARTWPVDVGIGIAAGLALMTKLTGLLGVAAILAGFGFCALRERRFAELVPRAAVIGLIALTVGGWYYAHNLVVYGYIYPQDLSTHSVMFSMPPGERHVTDYFRIPLATFTDPHALSPDLLNSIWGTTYVTLWYEAHGHFLPEHDALVSRVGTVVLLLALLPTLAFAVGLVRASKRALASASAPEGMLLLLSALTVAGYVAFTWGNPWFATVKGSYLLGMSVPFAYVASEQLAEWTRPPGLRARFCTLWLAALFCSVCVAFTYGIGMWNLTPPGEMPGIEWNRVAPS